MEGANRGKEEGNSRNVELLETVDDSILEVLQEEPQSAEQEVLSPAAAAAAGSGGPPEKSLWLPT